MLMEKVIHGVVGGLHILAVITWVGSMIYSQFAVMPALRNSLGNAKSHAVSGLIMRNFVPITWTSLIVVTLTGIYSVLEKKERFIPITNVLGTVLMLKLFLVLALIVLFLLQVFIYGQKMKQLILPSTPKTIEVEMEMVKIEQTTKRISWWHLGIGITIVVLGVILSVLSK